jgi:glycosyltransferase involved in cell wall biosynthesis
LGRVNDEELIDLYSNALYTLFTFAHEPFGYVSVEGMACSIPVLICNRQRAEGERDKRRNGLAVQR